MMKAKVKGRCVTVCGMLLWAFFRTVVTEGAVTEASGEMFTVRVLPHVASTNGHPLRLGFQTGFLEGPSNPLRAECFSEASLGVEGRVSVKAVSEAGAGPKRFRVANADDETRGVSLTTRILRRRIGHTIRVNVRRVEGRGALRFVFEPVGGTPEERTEKRVSVKGKEYVEKAFAVKPLKDGAYRCAFEIEPGSVMEFGGFSMLPDDAEEGWDHEALEALRLVRPCLLRWPDQEEVGFYNWYDGVGPRTMRRAVSPMARAEDGHDFGTVEFVGLCRLLGTEPVMRVTVYHPGVKDDRVRDLAAGVQLAADWVAYCNAVDDRPLAKLRMRHGCAAALGVTRWELVTEKGGVPDASVCNAYASAMRKEDPTLAVSVGAPALMPVYDRYVTKVMARLSAGAEPDRRYYGAWFESLGMAYAAIERLRKNEAADLCTRFHPEQVLFRVTYARNMLTEAGLIMAMYNNCPAFMPLVTTGVPTEESGSFRVQAAWAEDDSTLVIFIYNSAVEPRTVRFDLTALRRRFGVWIADQLAADITARRVAQNVPVSRTQKAGAAVTQWLEYTAMPSSFTRILVKE